MQCLNTVVGGTLWEVAEGGDGSGGDGDGDGGDDA